MPRRRCEGEQTNDTNIPECEFVLFFCIFYISLLLYIVSIDELVFIIVGKCGLE